jgi:uncharacterized protein with ParB-like and HNH nuclease domain
MYEGLELIIDPEFQRLFRWNISQKSRLIESLLLGICPFCGAEVP